LRLFGAALCGDSVFRKDLRARRPPVIDHDQRKIVFPRFDFCGVLQRVTATVVGEQNTGGSCENAALCGISRLPPHADDFNANSRQVFFQFALPIAGILGTDENCFHCPPSEESE
jgi:hypothetical protein